MKHLILYTVAAVLVLSLKASASLADDIQAIKDKIDQIDLNQSRDDIQSDLDDIKSDLDNLTEPETTYVTPTSPAKSAYQFVPVHSKIVNGHKYVWTESDNPQIGWHWVKVN